MRNIMKAATLESKFPLLAVNNRCRDGNGAAVRIRP